MMEVEKSNTSFRLRKDVIEILRSKPNQSAYLENLITSYEDGSLVPKEANDTSKKEADYKKRIQNLKLTLECWKLYKDLGGIAPKIDLLQVIEGHQEMPTLTTESLQTIQTIKEAPKSWHHFCKSVNRTVEFQIDIKECKWCGVEQ